MLVYIQSNRRIGQRSVVSLFQKSVWRDFFSQFATKQVVFVTIALDNRELLEALVERRRIRKQLHLRLGWNVNMDDKQELKSRVNQLIANTRDRAGWFQKLWTRSAKVLLGCCLCFLDEDEMLRRLETTEEKVKALQKKSYPVSNVFVTFETEEGQRNALAALSVSKLSLWRNNANAVAHTVVFHGRLLQVSKPKEPSDVRWQDLGVQLKVNDILICVVFWVRRIIYATDTACRLAFPFFLPRRPKCFKDVFLLSWLSQ